MSYHRTKQVTYALPAADAGAGAKTLKFQGPKGKKGRVIDYGFYNVTEAFTATTLPSYVSVGDGSDVDAYGDEISMGTTAIGGGSSLLTQYRNDQLDDYVLGDIPADQEVTVTATAPTGGTPAGIGTLFCVVDWDN